MMAILAHKSRGFNGLSMVLGAPRLPGGAAHHLSLAPLRHYANSQKGTKVPLQVAWKLWEAACGDAMYDR